MTMLNLVILGLLVTVLLGALIPTITDGLIGANKTGNPAGPTGNYTGATRAIGSLVPVFLIMGVVLAFVGFGKKGGTAKI